MRISRQEAVDNHSRLIERNAAYRRYGYDADKGVAFVLSHALPLPGRILDIGTGKGRFLAALLSHASRVTSIDVDPSEQRYARLNVAYETHPGRVRFIIADAANLPWADRSFDNVVSMNALHHIRDLPRVVDEVLRVVRPAGKIVLADFSEKGFSIAETIHRHEDRIHERVRYRFQNLVERFTARGWTAVLRSGDCQEMLIASGRLPVPEGKKRRRTLKAHLKPDRPFDTTVARAYRTTNKPKKGMRQDE